MKPYVITIARGFGSGGREIGALLADRLGIHSYENRILTLAAQYSGRDEHDFVEVDERLRGNSLRQQLGALQKRFHPQPKLEDFRSDDRLFAFQAEIIRNLAEQESCVIVGKCADYVLKSYDNVLSVYIEAPRAYCLKRVVSRMQVTEEEAHRLISRTDKYRAEYYQYYTGGNYWTNPVNYDLTLNTGRLEIDQCVEIILHALTTKFPEAAELLNQSGS